MNAPKVSIIVPCYNAEKWINRCVSSALEQTYKNVEVIAVDNESKDNTLNILKSIHHPKLRVTTAKNIYPFCWDEARAKGFSLAQGKYLFTLASDDLLHRDYVKNCLRYFNNGKVKVQILQSAIRSIDSDGNFLRDVNHSYHSLQGLKEMLLTKCPINSPTVVYDRELYDNGLLETNPEKFSGAADYDLYCSLVDKEYFIFSAGSWIGYCYRWHGEQATWQMHKKETNYDLLIQDKWRKKWSA